MKYRIFCRYQYMSYFEGKQWTSWFPMSFEKSYGTEEEADARVKELSKVSTRKKYAYEYRSGLVDEAAEEKRAAELWEKERKKALRREKTEDRKKMKAEDGEEVQD